MTPPLHGTYDHGRLLLDGEPPWPRAAVLVTFLREEPLPALKPFEPRTFAFDDCRNRLARLSLLVLLANRKPAPPQREADDLANEAKHRSRKPRKR